MPSGIKLSVNLKNIVENAKLIKQYCGVKLCAMVKSNAYGHGLIPVAKALQRQCSCFGVARLSEALSLRQAGILTDILVCSDFDESYAVTASDCNIMLTVSSLDELKACGRQAEKNKRLLYVHIKIDSGMNRLGIKAIQELYEMLSFLKGNVYIKADGIYTHFSDCGNDEFTGRQFELFSQFVNAAKKQYPGITAHCASSSAIFSDKKYHADMVRPGLFLYGYDNGKAFNQGVSLLPAMEAETKVLAVKKAEAGEYIGYGRNYFVTKDLYYAVVSAGYGDGYKRAFSNCGSVLINGRLCPVLGNICMDTFMVELNPFSADEVKAGDKVYLFSDIQGKKEISFEYSSALCGTITYELLTSFTERVKREYTETTDGY